MLYISSYKYSIAIVGISLNEAIASYVLHMQHCFVTALVSISLAT